jgi:hypothetical protein
MEQNFYELQTVYDSRNSFYGKANVTEIIIDEAEKNGETYKCKYLISYETTVAKIVYKINEKSVFCLENLRKDVFSNTTIRHIREFMRQNGFSIEADMSKKEILDKFLKDD